jgi:hypothetical protein
MAASGGYGREKEVNSFSRFFRLKLTYELIKAYGLLTLSNTRCVEAIMADEDDLAVFHDRERSEMLKAGERRRRCSWRRLFRPRRP